MLSGFKASRLVTIIQFNRNVSVAVLAARAKNKQGEIGNKKRIPTVFRYLC